MRYIDLLGGTKPHLLQAISNNLGLETRVLYAPSTQYYLQDKREGKAWATRLPFPVHVVARVEQEDRVQGTRLVTQYRYRHGYFDGAEREFRGFGLVEQWDAEFVSSAHGTGLFPTGLNEANGEFQLPPAHTKTWFHTGAWLEEERLETEFARECAPLLLAQALHYRRVLHRQVAKLPVELKALGRFCTKRLAESRVPVGSSP